MFVLLIGPKGSGKSHIGRVLERRLGVHFFHVEPLWMDYYGECAARGASPSIEEGMQRVHPRIHAALAVHEHVCVETTAASPEILGALLALAPEPDRCVVRVTAPLELCLQRVASRDPTHQIPMDIENVRMVHQRSSAADVPAALVLENVALSEDDIVQVFESALKRRPSSRRSG